MSSTLADSSNRWWFVQLNREIAQWLADAPGDAVLLTSREAEYQSVNGWMWGWPATYLESQGWKLIDYKPVHHYELVGPASRRVRVSVVEGFDRSRYPNACVLEVGSIGDESQGERVRALLKAHPCR